MLGWVENAEALTVTLLPHKRLKLHALLAEWPPSRVSASAKQVSQPTGFFMHISFAVRPGSIFVHLSLIHI